MGSLVPGWDGQLPGVPPKELQDNEALEVPPKGVFAKLDYSRSLKRSSMDPQHVAVGSPPGQPMLLPIPSLQRASSLRQGGPVPTPVASYGAAPASAAQRHPLSSSLGTSSMMMRAGPGVGVTSPKAPFKPTDWESEFKSLGSMKRTSMGPLARTSGEPQTDSGRSSAEHAVSTSWWSHMDTGALNRGAAADAEAAEAGATHLKDLRGSFKLDLPTGMNLH